MKPAPPTTSIAKVAVRMLVKPTTDYGGKPAGGAGWPTGVVRPRPCENADSFANFLFESKLV
ncbi:MAG: hypothetical protein R8M14_07485 [Ghiorsea sp.]